MVRYDASETFIVYVGPNELEYIAPRTRSLLNPRASQAELRSETTSDLSKLSDLNTMEAAMDGAAESPVASSFRDARAELQSPDRLCAFYSDFGRLGWGGGSVAVDLNEGDFGKSGSALRARNALSELQTDLARVLEEKAPGFRIQNCSRRQVSEVGWLLLSPRSRRIHQWTYQTRS